MEHSVYLLVYTHKYKQSQNLPTRDDLLITSQNLTYSGSISDKVNGLYLPKSEISVGSYL